MSAGRRRSGLPATAADRGYQVLSRGHIIGPYNYGYPLGSLCDLCLVSCSPSLVKLSGYPVRAISEVKIDGDILDSGDYRVHNRRYAMRLSNGHWPRRQNLTEADTEDGTFSISYTYGQDPPELGMAAAAELGCRRTAPVIRAQGRARSRRESPASPGRGS